MLKLIVIAITINNAFCWKPIIGPTSFSIKQQHPAAGYSHNSLTETDGVSGIESSLNYNGNSFLDEHTNGHDSGLLTGESEGRILSGNGYSGTSTSSIYDGLYTKSLGGTGQCYTDKYAFEHEGTAHIQHSLPKLEQFTLCEWMRFTNHSGDHTLFTYSVDHEPREIQFWIANTKDASYFSLAVHGQSLFRLNYPLKLRKWHHACASWNGKTGEWQLWVKAERVGRGFHNRIVGHMIDPHGIAFAGGPSFTGPAVEGLHMELTMIQLYKVALSAGKAHRDHKHHHVHHFNHDGLAPSTPQPTPPPQPLLNFPTNPLLANGQIATRVRINLAGVQQQEAQTPVQGLPSQIVGGSIPQPQQHATIGTQFVIGQFSPADRFISQQLLGNQIKQQQSQIPATYSYNQNLGGATSFTQVGDPANVQYIDSNSNTRFLFKRNNREKTIVKRQADKTFQKRALVQLADGSVVDDRVIAENPYDFDGLALFGAQTFQDNLSKMMDIEDEIKRHDREPAEGEVQAILHLCSKCDPEPFKGAVVLEWKKTKVQISQALRGKSIGGCGDF